MLCIYDCRTIQVSIMTESHLAGTVHKLIVVLEKNIKLLVTLLNLAGTQPSCP